LSKALSLEPQVLKKLRELPKDTRTECLLALCDLIESFGRPHVHIGLGLRKLGPNLFECRGNRSLRFLFEDRPGELFVSFLGNHDEIKAALRAGRRR
jgi:hypothetical protein